jgi:phosphotransacetylase
MLRCVQRSSSAISVSGTLHSGRRDREGVLGETSRTRSGRSRKLAEIANSQIIPKSNRWWSISKRLQRRGYTERDVRRMVNQERNVFAALLVALGTGDG